MSEFDPKIDPVLARQMREATRGERLALFIETSALLPEHAKKLKALGATCPMAGQTIVTGHLTRPQIRRVSGFRWVVRLLGADDRGAIDRALAQVGDRLDRLPTDESHHLARYVASMIQDHGVDGVLLSLIGQAKLSLTGGAVHDKRLISDLERALDRYHTSASRKTRS